MNDHARRLFLEGGGKHRLRFELMSEAEARAIQQEQAERSAAKAAQYRREDAFLRGQRRTPNE